MKAEQGSIRTTAAFRKAFSMPAVHYILLTVVCLLAYANTFHVPFQYDDVDRMIKRPFVQDVRLFFDPAGREKFANEHDFKRRPVGYLTFALNYWLHGTNVVGYHIINLVIHVANALLLYKLVALSFRTPSLQKSSLKDRAQIFALFPALLFASHPIQTEAITYIVQRLASLATFFYLLSLVMYIKWRLVKERAKVKAGEEEQARVKKDEHMKFAASIYVWYFLSLVSAVLAMKTKEISFTLPVIMMLYEIIFFRGKVGSRVLGMIPLLMTMLIIPISVAGTTGKPFAELMSDAGGMFRAHSMLSRWEYLATEMRVIVTYIRLLLLPVGQSLDHDYPLHHSFLDPAVYLSLLVLSAIAGIGVYCLYRSRFALHDPRHSPSPFTSLSLRLMAFGIFWFFITLAVESSIVPIADVISEHRLYLPSIGFIVACTSALFFGAEKLTARPESSVKTLITLLATTTLVLAGLTFARNMAWKTEASLWEDVIQKSPMKARGYNGLGLAYYDMRQYDGAVEQFERAVSLYPSYGVAFNNLGNALSQKGLYDRAIEAQTRAIALEPDNPVFYFGRAVSLANRGDYDGAIGDYTRAIAIDPNYADAYNNLGFVYHLRGVFPLAIEQYSKAIALDARNAIFFSNRGLAYAGKGELDKAIEDYTQAIALNSSLVSAYSGRGVAYSYEGRHFQAINDFDRAILLEPGNAELYVSRGVAHMRAGHRSEALADFQHACDKGSEAGCRTLLTEGRR